MKLTEVLASNIEASNKTEDAKTFVKILRKKADKKNRKKDSTEDHSKDSTIDSFAGYINNSFAQSNWS